MYNLEEQQQSTQLLHAKQQSEESQDHEGPIARRPEMMDGEVLWSRKGRT
jgi:hypothetical protein